MANHSSLPARIIPRFALRHSWSVHRWSVFGRLAAVVLLLVLYRSVFWPGAPGRDFVNHRIFGGRFLDNCPLYEGALNTPYPPFWAAAHAPFAQLSQPVAFAVYHALGVAAFLVLIGLTARVTGRRAAAIFLVLLVARPFILRDLHDGGANLMIVSLAWCGMFLWSRGRGGIGAACLGFAIALKCTPAIFLIYFVAKRRGRMLAASAGMALLFSLTPALRQGPAVFREHAERWWQQVRAGAQAPPGWGVIGAEEMRNCSLRAALARQIVDFPDDHPGRLAHPWRGQALHLTPRCAGHVIRIVPLVLLGVVFVRLCRSAGEPEIEWAAVALLMPLLSPITWGQHCVAAIPALALLFDRWLRQRRRRDALLLAGVSAFYGIGLNRALVSAMGAGLIASYGLLTASLLMLLAACLDEPARPSESG